MAKQRIRACIREVQAQLAGDGGADLRGPADGGWLFGEDQARYVLGVHPDHAEAVAEAARVAQIPAQNIGISGAAGAGAALTLNGRNAISVAELRALHDRWLPAYMAGG